jgi:hypothetical protein
MPKSITPDICETGGYILKIVSGGTCSLTYKSAGNSSFLPSDTYIQTLLIEKQAQTINFQPPQSININNGLFELTANASSGGRITYSTVTSETCTLSGSNLNLLKIGNCFITATQAGTALFAPISTTKTISLVGTKKVDGKKINCVKGKKIRKITGTNPMCPSGFKLK